MVFSSVIFIFAFLPCCLFGYYVLFRKSRAWQNVFLFACSILFYAWGGVKYTLLILFSILINWLMAFLLSKSREKKAFGTPKLFLVIAIVINIAVLFVFKYLNFTVNNINTLFGTNLVVPPIALPIGISFFTFQGMSYVIDVYRRHGEALSNPLEVGLYIAFFPQLIAGPIVRYETVAEQIHNRKETTDLFCNGIERFIIGLGKKAVLADTLAIVVNQVFTQYYAASALSAWLGAIFYTLQLYYDFSGYSDMAIGLGKMFGFEFLENFDHPYISSSISEFWRRWHISMGTWFRDYVYFPLGGSRVPLPREILNLFIVWLLTGIWHGANWTFILWGMLQFVFILLERLTGLNKTRNRALKGIGHVYSLLVIIVGWVLFNSDSIGSAIQYLKSMLFIGVPAIDPYFLYAVKSYGVTLALAILFCFPLRKLLQKTTLEKKRGMEVVKYCLVLVLFVFSVAYIVKGSYSPFIYFNF